MQPDVALRHPNRVGERNPKARITLRLIALGYLTLLIVLPLLMVLYRTFENGLGPVWDAATTPEALHALRLTTLLVAITVPLNAVFGVICALAIVRQRFPGRSLLEALAALPLAVSPVVVGLSLVLVYGRRNDLGHWLWEHGIRVIFAMPGMVLATIFVSLPFVVREVVPVLRELGTDQEQAAGTLGATGWQTFWLITLPSIRSGILFGVVLTTSRALGEYGAVSVVSGKLSGKTTTLTLHVEERFQMFDMTGAYVAAVELAVIALITLVAMHAFKPAHMRSADSGDANEGEG